MTKLQHREWPIYLVLVLIAVVLVYLGRHHIMQIYYNHFLLGLGGLSLCLVLVAWAVGGSQSSMAEEAPE